MLTSIRDRDATLMVHLDSSSIERALMKYYMITCERSEINFHICPDYDSLNFMFFPKGDDFLVQLLTISIDETNFLDSRIISGSYSDLSSQQCVIMFIIIQVEISL